MSSMSAAGTTFSARCAVATAATGTLKSAELSVGVSGKLMTRDHALHLTKVEKTL